MKKLCIALLLSSCLGLSAQDRLIFESCDKTYVDPFLVKLQENIIEIAHKGEITRTSALFSDEGGLYYKDILRETKKEIEAINLVSLFDESFFLHAEEESVDPFVNLDNSSSDLVTFDQLIEPHITATPPTSQVPNTPAEPLGQVRSNPTSPPKGIWPYCNKPH